MMDGNTFLLIRQDARGRTVLYESEDLPKLAEFIEEKEAREQSRRVADGGAAWQDRLPQSMDGGDS
jgi:hypothetical protein